MGLSMCVYRAKKETPYRRGYPILRKCYAICVFSHLEHREPVEDSQDAPRHLRSNATTLVAEQMLVFSLNFRGVWRNIFK